MLEDLKRLGIIAAGVAVLVSATALLNTALGQPACAERKAVIAHLKAKYQEEPRELGLANNGGVIEVLSAPNGASWTIIVTMPHGPTCLVAAGKNWEKVPVKSVKGERS